MKSVKYRINSVKKSDVINHLNTCSDQFIPKLDSYVNIEAYSQKIFQKAITFEAWCDKKLIGLVAIYIDIENGFITNVSVDQKFKGFGVFRELINLCFDFCKLMKIKKVELDVNKRNEKVIEIYKHIGFELSNEKKKDNSLVMFYKLNY